MSQTVSLREWQREALDTFSRHREPNFLTVACPGAGKTTFALAAIRQRLRGRRLPVAIVVPTSHLKVQWASAALRFGLHLDPNWTSTGDGLPADMHGVIVTYSQAARAANRLRPLLYDGVVVLDEVHHAATDKSWGDGIASACRDAACRLLLSGTPFRSDDSPMPFVRYSEGDYGDAEADYEYGYGEALKSGGVVRPVFFPRFDGLMEWVNSGGETHEATFDDDLASSEWGGRLRTALSVDGQWLPTVVDHAQKRLMTIRAGDHPNAGGLVIATDHEHARGIASMLEQRHGEKVDIALSDDPKASEIIENFATSDTPWIVAVRMISEGVDIPRLRVGVFATTTTTALFFRQAVGRLARWTPGMRSQRSYLYVPDDPRLRRHAINVAEQRHHSIAARRRRMAEDGELDDLTQPVRAEEQISLFAAVSSSVLGGAENEVVPEDGVDVGEDLPWSPEDALGHSVALPPPPPLTGGVTTGLAGAGGPEGLAALRSRRAEKQRLRELNATRVLDIVRSGTFTHAEVNIELNRQAGIDRIAEATEKQLADRLTAADRWLSQVAR